LEVECLRLKKPKHRHGAADDVLFCELLISTVTSLMTFIDRLRFSHVFFSVWFVFVLVERFHNRIDGFLPVYSQFL